ncbi:MAG: xanthine dehydrogenase family protein molybdopterin-binding subunit, partial [Dehalococcoidia bacterium]
MTPTDYEHNIVLETEKYDVVGTRPVRHDGHNKVTGRDLYGADFQAAGLLHGRILRSPHPHARIKSIDTSKAEALAGVRAVVTGKDLPPANGDIDLHYRRANILADEKVLYVGHAVAAVAATSPHIAEEALELVHVEYELLPYVLTAPEAMKEDAPLLHDDLKTESMGQPTDKVSNIATYFQLRLGDVDKGFADADEIVEGQFSTKTVHQGYIE